MERQTEVCLLRLIDRQTKVRLLRLMERQAERRRYYVCHVTSIIREWVMHLPLNNKQQLMNLDKGRAIKGLVAKFTMKQNNDFM